MMLVTKLPSNLPEVIYCFRHGQSVGNELGLDDNSLATIPNHKFKLTKTGIDQAHQLAEFIHSSGILQQCKSIYVSSFLRAQQTLEIILRDKNRVGYEDTRLDEWWKGIFHSLGKENIAQHYPMENAVLEREGWYHYSPPQGESGKAVERRLLNFLNDLEDNCIISGHARTAAFMKRILCSEPIDLNCKYDLQENCELWKFKKQGEKYILSSEFKPKSTTIQYLHQF